MIIYQVTVSPQREIEAEWLDWMMRVHVPDVVRTQCFSQATVFKVRDAGEQPSYVMQYRCETLADYERYRDNFAAELQKDHSARYAGRFTASRQILEEVTVPRENVRDADG